MVARHVAAAVGLDHSSAVDGLAVHMGLAVTLGIGLTVAVRMLGSRLTGLERYSASCSALSRPYG